FYAYTQMGKIKNASGFTYEKSLIMSTYVLCGFSNFASIGIQIGGIGALAPSKRADLAALGFRAMIGGSLACLMTATIAGMFY
ncbi:MAG TPA: nucleoside transporter C-terminal domain-containing protein, partial [Bacteroidia bacterium]